MKKKLGVILSMLVAASITLVGCGNKQTSSTPQTNKDSKGTKIMFSGSSTMAPVISKIGDNFTEKNKTWKNVESSLSDTPIQIAVSSGGSGTGVKAALEKTSNFGLVSREVSKDEKSKMPDYREFKIGMDALTISVNPENPILTKKKGLTKVEIQKIFSGEAKLWSDVDPSLPKNKIVVVVRDASGGAGEVFEKSVMGDKKVSKEAIQSPSMGALGQKIIENKDAIGYASVGIVDQNKAKITAMDVDGVAPTSENILSGKYIIARPLSIIKNGELSGEEKAFITYVTSDEGLKVVKELGFVPTKPSK
ncbi:phosphate ABC transporter substrate-binding protein [Clostridium magnum]|uniref:Phosphate-binding protein PstS n=1 Tax=Clostridium magnum DSM 2767 TaxID=1121326 RepID=A0A162T4V2_9CLOT|nr:phosphate ABC transporter substrate-binding protein [Clostridium magnum]KZL92247.1 phosphate-binding protein PstS precursor [Clostridium magnum DSM 2767]SHH16330.1 phosphate ABC transporter substrate-binding protein, PhoT family [Clostridium magnum DSM 2767]